MGVISHNRATLPNVTFRDDFFTTAYLIESPNSTDVEDDDHHEVDHHFGANGSPRRRRSRFGQLKVPHVKAFGGLSAKSRPGARKMRRVENNKMLLSMTDVEDICEDLSDILPDTTTAFSQLFMETDKMKIWNEFVHKSEEEQLKILKNGFNKFRCNSESAKHDDVKSAKPSTSADNEKDERARHPAFYSAQHRYHKIDNNLRFLLSHKESSWGKLHDIEASLVDFFKQDPKGVWTGSFEPFDRILLHAAAQYLFLRACSFDAGGERKTKVTNKYKLFVVPQEFLDSYLKKITCQS